MYAERANNMKTKFSHFELSKISRSKNEAVDGLAKITFGETPNDEGIETELHSPMHSIQPRR